MPSPCAGVISERTSVAGVCDQNGGHRPPGQSLSTGRPFELTPGAKKSSVPQGTNQRERGILCRRAQLGSRQIPVGFQFQLQIPKARPLPTNNRERARLRVGQ
ncbi:unnamed protein product [Lampetra fluviatilis]